VAVNSVAEAGFANVHDIANGLEGDRVDAQEASSTVCG